MKRCPTCEKTFDDALRFCQADGTPLVEAAEPVDLYKTMVARPEDLAAAIPKAPIETPAVKEDDEVLQIPAAEVDPNKTMYASEEEIRGAMAETDKADEQVMEIPAYPDPPKFEEPKLSPPSFGDTGKPPPSPYSPSELPASPFSKTSYPIPSPFDKSMPPGTDPGALPLEPATPETPQFAEPEPAAPAFNPFSEPSPAAATPIAQTEWTPPLIPQSNFQEQSMQNPQFQQGSPPTSGGQSQTLAIVSLVTGILGLTLCCGFFIPSLVAVITGFMARGKASTDPANYGGAGLALGGLVTGAIGMVGSLVVLIYVIFNFAVIAAMMASQ